MPFTRTTDPPSVTPPVAIKFSGLMVLQPGPMTDTCEIGIHRLDREHVFQMALMVSKPNPIAGQPPLPPIMVPLITGSPTSPILIRFEPDPDATRGTFVVFARDPFDRTLPTSHVNDYRWGINLRSKHLDAQITENARPTVILKTGVLYSPDLTRAGLNPQLICGAATDILNSIASHFAASIVPPANTLVVVEWTDQGNPRDVSLPRPNDPPGTVYTLYLINEPGNFDGLFHEELGLYYRILQSGGAPIPVNQRCQLRFPPHTRTDEIPCPPITLNP